MRRLLFIARFEYIQQFKRPAFLFALFGTPILFAVLFLCAGLLGSLFMLSKKTEQAIGYVDQTGIIIQEDSEQPATASIETVAPTATVALTETALATTTTSATTSATTSLRSIDFIPYASEEEAHAAFMAGDVDAYVIIPPDYLDRGSMTSYGHKHISMEGRTELRLMLRHNLLAHESSRVALRAPEPLSNLNHRMLKEPSVASQDNESATDEDTEEDRAGDHRETLWFMPLSFMFSFFFISTIFTSSSYLLHGLVEEKENRTMEIVVTSVTPEQLIAGKTLGLGAIGLTQPVVWLMYGVIPATLGAIFSEEIRTVLVSVLTDILPLVIMFFVPTYIMYAGIISAIGSMVVSVQEGQQVSSFFSLPMMLPFLLMGVIESNPHGTVALIASFLPFTAPLTIMLRLSIADVPTWQVLLSLSILVASAIAVIFITARIFRIGMLRYGTSLKPREILRMLIGKITMKRQAKKGV